MLESQDFCNTECEQKTSLVLIKGQHNSKRYDIIEGNYFVHEVVKRCLLHPQTLLYNTLP